jgi:energy-coupling factor transport system ATP-binding protein
MEVPIPNMGRIVTENLSFRYANSRSNSLMNINLRIDPGDFILVVGPTGCGKSTLLKTFNGLIPHVIEGEMSGRVTVDGKDTREHKVRELARHVGMVFQNPEAQLFSLYVEEEVMLGPWNLGLPKDEMRRRVDEALKIVGMAEKHGEPIFQLSDGQKQKTALASILAMKPTTIVLDEPTSNIDIESALEIAAFLEKLNKEQGYTIVVAEHRTGLFARIASRVVAMENGKIVADGPPEAVFGDHSLIARLGIRPIKHAEEIAYFNLQNIMAQLNPEACKHTPSNRSAKVDDYSNSKVVVEVDRLYYSYSKRLPFVLQNISFTIRCGEFVGLVGPNGAGKTTLALNLIGLLRPTSGRVLIDGVDAKGLKVTEIAKRIGYVFQNPDYQLFTGRVSEEVTFGLDFTCDGDRKPTVCRETALNLLREVGLLELKDKHPYALSRGQRRRLALASVIALGQKIIIVDEPTTGQDYKHSKEIMEILSKLCEEGCATIVITHDIPLITEYATRVMVLDSGRIIVDTPTQEILRKLGCSAPPVCRGKDAIG